MLSRSGTVVGSTVPASCQVDDFSAWWHSNSGDRSVLFSPVLSEIGSGQSRRKASGKELMRKTVAGTVAAPGLAA